MGLTLLKIEEVFKVKCFYDLFENVSSSLAANVIILSFVNVLEVIATWKFQHSLPRSAQHAVTESILRQTGDFCCPVNRMEKLA